MAGSASGFEFAAYDGEVIVTAPERRLMEPEAARELARLLVMAAEAAEQGLIMTLVPSSDARSLN